MNVFELAAKLIFDATGYKKGLSDAENDTASFASRVSNTAGTVGKALGDALVNGATAIGTAVVGITKSAVASYGEYEQLVGGVETLFKNSSDTVQDYAANAYKTAGLSANQYMETVTSFAASLLQSLGGDTEAAAKYADTAVTDMADNANKMGTNIQSIQNAYQGFAKQNYTMLDNLKLGYGGTKTEMERLVLDAEKLNSSFKATRDENGELAMSYADIVDAIHIVQQDIGITGTTAAEAAGTIQGSTGSMKAAWQNLVTGLADGNADIDTLLGEFIESFTTTAQNLLPIISKALEGVIKLAQGLVEKAPEFIEQFLPIVADGVTSIIASIVSVLPQLFETGGEMLGTLIQGILDNLPSLISTALEVIVTLGKGIGEALPELIPSVVNVIMTIVKQITSPESLLSILSAALTLIKGLASGIISAIPILIQNLPLVIENIIDFLVDAIPLIVDTGIELLSSLVGALPTIITSIVTALPSIINGITKFFGEAVPQLVFAGTKLFLALIGAMPDIIVEIVKAMPDIIKAIVDSFKNVPQMMSDIGGDIVRGLWEGIKGLGSWIWDNVSGWASDLFNGVKDFFGIHSPSKKFEYIGENMSKGLGKGFVDEMRDVESDMLSAVPTNFDANSSFQTGAGSGYVRNAANQNLTIVLEVDKQRFAKAVVDLGRLEQQRQGRVLFSI